MQRTIRGGCQVAALLIGLLLMGGGTAVAATIPVSGPFPYDITQPGDYILAGNVSTKETAIRVLSSRVRLNLNGFTITGPRTNGNCYGKNGIEVGTKVTHVSIQGGTVCRFENGILVGKGVQNLLVTRMKLLDNCLDGVDADAPYLSGHTYSYTVAARNGDDGFDLAGKGHHLCFNWANDNGDTGIEADGDGYEFACNTAGGNLTGMSVLGNRNLFWANTISLNLDIGIVLLGQGNGFGRNKTSENGTYGIWLRRGSRDNVLRRNVSLGNATDYRDENLDAVTPIC
jgi:hypothetical protein